MSNIQKTLSIIKPDAVQRNLTEEIKNIFKKNGFEISSEKKIKISKEEAEKFLIKKRDIDDNEIIERLLYAMINEGAHILGEGIASRASDIDVVFVHGYGMGRYLSLIHI